MKKRKLEYHGATVGKKQPQLYQIWAQIKQRCFNKKHRKYKNYGARGITMDPRWRKSYATFEEELHKAIGPRPSKKHSLGRIDNDKGYWPGNVRWETATQQARNKRTTRLILHDGKRRPLAEVVEQANPKVRYGTVEQRMRLQKLSLKEALTRPLRPGVRRMIKWRGETLPLHQWALRLKMGYQMLHNRIFKLGWPVERAFTTPSQRPKVLA